MEKTTDTKAWKHIDCVVSAWQSCWMIRNVVQTENTEEVTHTYITVVG